jgi:hypothetical protein
VANIGAGATQAANSALRTGDFTRSAPGPAGSAQTAAPIGPRVPRWTPASRRITAGAALVCWALAAGLAVRVAYGPRAAAVAVFAAAVLTAGCGALAHRLGHRGTATAVDGTAGVLAVLGAWTLAGAAGWGGAAALGAAAAACVLGLVLLGVCSPLGGDALAGAGSAGVLALVWEGVAATQHGGASPQEQARTGAVLAVVSVVALGLLPRFALVSAGLTALDDRRSGGVSVSRYLVGAALSATHRGLTLTTLTLAVSAGAGGVLALRAPTPWTVPLAVLTALVLALRSRAFPLVVEVLVLLLAAAAVAVSGVVVWSEHAGGAGAVAVSAVLALVSATVLAVQLPERAGAWLGRLCDLAESVGLIALFPLLVGVFGVYGRLLGTLA